MNAFVTGATGFIGFHLVETLLERGNQVTCLIRDKKQKLEFKKNGCRIFIADLTDPKLKEKLKSVLKGIDVVFHLAALSDEWGPSKSEYQKINVEAVKNLLQASLEAKVKHVIITSTAHVLGNPPKKIPASEKASPSPSSEYACSKLAAEKLALSYFNKGLPITILRPSFVYGPRDRKGAIYRFFNQAKKKKIIIVGNGKNRFQPIYVQDLIEAYLAAAKNKGKGEIYLIAGDEKVSLNKLFFMISRSLGVKSLRIIKIPKWIAFPLSYPLALAFALGKKLNLPILRNEPLIDPRKVNFITGNFIFETQKAKKELGFKPKYKLKEGLEKTANYLKFSFSEF